MGVVLLSVGGYHQEEDNTMSYGYGKNFAGMPKVTAAAPVSGLGDSNDSGQDVSNLATMFDQVRHIIEVATDVPEELKSEAYGAYSDFVVWQSAGGDLTGPEAAEWQSRGTEIMQKLEAYATPIEPTAPAQTSLAGPIMLIGAVIGGAALLAILLAGKK